MMKKLRNKLRSSTNKLQESEEKIPELNMGPDGIPLLEETEGTRAIPVSKVESHFLKVNKPFHPKTPDIPRSVVEYNFIEQKSLISAEEFQNVYASAIKPHNQAKNRYENVLPVESTRVKLSGGDQCDYINGNFISGLIPGTERQYIATQGPTRDTQGDFWRMVVEYEISVILMLTRAVENNVLKCEEYCPQPNRILQFGSLQIGYNDQVPEPITQTPELTTRYLKYFDTQTGASGTLTHFQYTNWPDYGVPETTGAYVGLAKRVSQANPTNKPILVHCSAGIGRTGSFCAIHSILQKIDYDKKNNPQKEPEVSLINTILYHRKQRSGMVQSVDQYVFCWRAISDAIKASNQQPVKATVIKK